MNQSLQASLVEANIDPFQITLTIDTNLLVYRILKHLFKKDGFLMTMKMIRFFLSEHLNSKEVMLMCLVSKEVHDNMFAQGNYRGFDYFNFTRSFTIKCPDTEK